MVKNDKLIEGHPIGVNKIIQGNLQTKTRIINGETQIYQMNNGQLLWDSQEKRNRPWFILVYESGERVKD